MTKYKTLKEQRDREWKKFEQTNEDKWKAGTYIPFEEDALINIHEFCPTSLCNLFHVDDMAEILVGLKTPFVVNFLHKDGREYLCQIIIVKGRHSFDVFASGYGTGDWIKFSKGFPDKLKFEMCREMAIQQNSFLERYSKDNIDDDKRDQRMKEYAKREYIKHRALFELLYGYARTLDDLKAIAELYYLTTNKSFYDKYGKEDGYKKSSEEFRIKWGRLVKSNLYKKYQIFLLKEKKEYEKEVN